MSAASDPSPTRWPLHKPSGAALLAGLSIAVVLVLAAIPVLFLVVQSFLTPHTARSAAVFTLDNHGQAFFSRDSARLLWTSLRFAGGAALLSFAIGAALAWVSERTQAPGRSLFMALALVPLVMPGILFTVAWILLASPQVGLLNRLLQHLFGLPEPLFDIYSMAGMIWTEALHHSPVAFLLMSTAFRAMDPSLEESATMSGASARQVFLRVTLKLAAPAALATLLILFVKAIESFEVPALLGVPAGIQVYTSSIYEAVHNYPSELGLAASHALLLLVITGLGTYGVSRLAGDGKRHATITGKGSHPRRIELGGWRWPVFGLCLGYFLLVVGLPFAVLLWSSLQDFYVLPSWQALQDLTVAPYRRLFGHPGLSQVIWNSLLLACGAATVVMLVTAVIAWVVLRTRLPGRRALDNLASLPLAVPGLVLGLALMVFFLHVDIGVYGTMWILLIAYVTRFLPYGMRFNAASLLQVHPELEESAALCGASGWASFTRIVLPLLRPGLIAGWITIVIVALRELSSSILLYSPGTEVISVVIWELWENGHFGELCAFGVLFILALLTLVLGLQGLGRKFGIQS